MTHSISCLWVSHSSGVLKLILSRLHNVDILSLMRYWVIMPRATERVLETQFRVWYDVVFPLITCLVFIHEDIRQYVNAIVIHKLSNPLDCNINITWYRIKKEIIIILAAWKPYTIYVSLEANMSSIIRTIDIKHSFFSGKTF